MWDIHDSTDVSASLTDESWILDAPNTPFIRDYSHIRGFSAG